MVSINGGSRALKYVGCAVGIVFAATTQAYIVAAIACAIVFAEAFEP